MDVLLDRAVGFGDTDDVDRLVLRIRAGVGDLLLDVPVHALEATGGGSGAGTGLSQALRPDHDGDLLTGVRPIRLVRRTEHELDRAPVGRDVPERVTLQTGLLHGRQLVVIGREDRRRVVVGDEVVKLLAAGDLRRDESRDAGTDVALAARHVLVRRQLVRLLLRPHHMALRAERGRLGVVDGHAARHADEHTAGSGEQDQGHQEPSTARQPPKPAEALPARRGLRHDRCVGTLRRIDRRHVGRRRELCRLARLRPRLRAGGLDSLGHPLIAANASSMLLGLMLPVRADRRTPSRPMK